MQEEAEPSEGIAFLEKKNCSVGSSLSEEIIHKSQRWDKSYANALGVTKCTFS